MRKPKAPHVVFLALTVILFLIAFGFYMGNKINNNNERVLRFGLGSGGWGPLFPAQQSSLYAAIIISHVFDSLIGVDNTGGFIPNLAKAWDINKDYTTYTFVIDTERRFSDGTKLTAQIYKDSLLKSLQLQAAATNKSALDVLYALEGYADFARTGDIKGLEVLDGNILKMNFNHTFRGAIDQLSGTRYGAYIEKDGKYIGTGPYVYKKIGDDYVELEANKSYPFELDVKKARISTEGLDALYENKIDIALSPFTFLPNTKNNFKNEKLSSLLISHWVIVPNGMPGRVFSNPKLRSALQYLIYTKFYNYCEVNDCFQRFTPDLQFYDKLFLGRLSDDKAMAILNDGKKYLEELRIVSAKKPIMCLIRPSLSFDYCEILKENGISTVRKETDGYAETKNILYKTFDADIVSMSVTFASSDPDGIYHFLGRNGAIWTPLASRSRVETLIEEGRLLADSQKIDDHYKKVSLAILEEVPVIHLGCQNLFLEYNTEILEPLEKIQAKRKAINVTLFKWR